MLKAKQKLDLATAVGELCCRPTARELRGGVCARLRFRKGLPQQEPVWQEVRLHAEEGSECARAIAAIPLGQRVIAFGRFRAKPWRDGSLVFACERIVPCARSDAPLRYPDAPG